MKVTFYCYEIKQGGGCTYPNTAWGRLAYCIEIDPVGDIYVCKHLRVRQAKRGEPYKLVIDNVQG